MSDAMTNHSDTESLAAFVDGRLDRVEREAVVKHLQTCEECQGLVREAGAFEQEEEAAAARKPRRTWWAAAAAVSVVVLGSAPFVPEYRHRRELKQDRGDLFDALVKTGRTTEARFSGQDAYAKVRPTLRGGNDKTNDEMMVDGAAADLALASADRHSPADLQAAALAAAFDGNQEKSLDNKARDALAILNRIPKEERTAAIWNDIATLNYRLTQFPEALAAVDEALRNDSKMAEAMFNRALILGGTGDRKAAVEAWVQYVAVHSSSTWADEVPRRIQNLAQSK